MVHLYRCIVFSLRNLIFHRVLRHDPSMAQRFLSELRALAKSSEAQGEAALTPTRDLLTQFLLASVGLQIAKEPEQRIPRGVWLTALQRETIKKVNHYGYHAGLPE